MCYKNRKYLASLLLFYINNKVNNQPLYRMNCLSCLRYEKNIRVMLSDHEFELRKLKEDNSQEKALFQLNIQKQLRKWQQRYNKGKTQHEQNTKKWLNKIDEITNKCQFAIQTVKKESEETIQRQRLETKNTCQAQIDQITEKTEVLISQLKDNHQSQMFRTEKAYQSKISALQKRYQSYIEMLRSQATQKEENLKQDYENRISSLKHEKMCEQKQNVKLKQDHRRQRSQYLGEIYDTKVLVNMLQQSLKTLKASIYAKEQEIVRKQAQVKQTNENHKSELSVIMHQQQIMKKEFQESLIKQAKLFYERELQITTKYQDLVRSIGEKRQYQQRIFQSSILEIKSTIDNRPSRVEDVEEILVIRERLRRKEKEYEILQRQLKNYQLQLQNKEDLYNKLFIPTVNSTNLNESNALKKKELRIKRAGRSVSTVRDVLGTVNVQASSNLPSLTNIDKKLLPPRSLKIL